ncbi:DNA-directed DNA polymerase [Spizellomyces sp. 'palustris']|nr:DNA-directed DNA polymerase [Spizellomyces sp. 'palustris']
MSFDSDVEPAADESLLRPTSSTSEGENITFERKSCHSLNTCDKFIVKERVYTQQYAGIYFSRLNMLRPKVLSAAKERWTRTGASPPHIPRALDVRPGEVCYIAGTIYVDMPLKPNILDEVTQEHWVIAPPPRSKYASDADEVVLEDESGRVKLTGEILKDTMLVTGIIVAVLGCENASGDFEVIDLCYPQLAPQPTLSPSEGDTFIAVASGLSVGDETFNLELELLSDFLAGELGSEREQRTASCITRLILAGNSVAKPKLVEEEKRPARNKYGSENTATRKEPLHVVDTVLSQLCENLDVDILPGETDPANCSLPQQPIHFAIFPKASKFSTFNTVTNPYSEEIGSLSVLATSGQTIDDIFRFVTSEDRLSMAENTLRWAHLAPTAPDTLWCHPYKDTDPFIIKHPPHLYIIGNQPAYETTLVEDAKGSRTRIVLVPSFAESGTLILVNTRTLDCWPIVFKSGLM